MTHLVETDEMGRLVLPPELFGEVKPYTPYTVEDLGNGFYVKATETAEKTAVARQKVHEEWKRSWDALTEEISKVWPEGVSAADVVSEMRR